MTLPTPLAEFLADPARLALFAVPATGLLALWLLLRTARHRATLVRALGDQQTLIADLRTRLELVAQHQHQALADSGRLREQLGERAEATRSAVVAGISEQRAALAEAFGALREQLRVLKPGGRLVTLDTTPPRDGLMRPFIDLHLRYVIPALGRMVAGNADAYRYLPESTLGFKTAEQLADLMRAAGLVDVGFRRVMFGTMAIHWGVRPDGPLPSA